MPKMEDLEKVADYFTRVITMTNKMKAYGKEYD